MKIEDQRKAYTDGLRALADFLDNYPQFDLPYMRVGVWAYTQYDDSGWYDKSHITLTSEEVARRMRRGIPGWTKDPGDVSAGHVTYTKTFTPDDAPLAVTYSIYASKTGTCERVQVGVRHVEATEAHDEPVYEWKCQ